MNDALFLTEPPRIPGSELPEPLRTRWQPLRIGLVELFHYDSEEFWFHDGHLLLRGNNGTGKSKVLSLTLPFLFDASLKPSRIEPDGDAGKKMAWNLLMGKHERRIGYAWIEFGRIGEDGEPRYLTLGCGLSALAARPQVDHWFFATEQQRMGRDLWLVSAQRAVLSKDRLGLAVAGHGQVFDSAGAYRRAVDERLFHLGEARYAALMDTLIQLRQPQLSKKPNEETLSQALTEALPPLPEDLLGDVAQAMSQLEEYATQLKELVELGKAIGRFNGLYQQYARVNARRQARVLRSSQTGFDKASRELNDARAAFETAAREEREQQDDLAEVEERLARARAALEEMLADPLMQDANRLDQIAREVAVRRAERDTASAAVREAQERHARDAALLEACTEKTAVACAALAASYAHTHGLAVDAGLAGRGAWRDAALFDAPDALADAPEAAYGQLQQRLRQLGGERKAELTVVNHRLRQVEQAAEVRNAAQLTRDERADDLDSAAVRAAEAEASVAARGAALLDAWQSHADTLRELVLPEAEAVFAALADWVVTLDGDNPARRALVQAQHANSVRLALDEAELQQHKRSLDAQSRALDEERSRLAQGEASMPPAPYYRTVPREPGRPGAPFWQLVEFMRGRGIDTLQQAGLEAALEAAGILDAWVAPDGGIELADPMLFDTLLVERAPHAHSLSQWLEPAVSAAVGRERVARLLDAIACGPDDPGGAEAWMAPDGRFRMGSLSGRWNKPAAEYIGAASRAQARRRRIEQIDAQLDELRGEQAQVEVRLAQVAARRAAAEHEWQAMPQDEALREAHVAAAALALQQRQASERLAQADVRLAAAEETARKAREQLRRDADDLRLPGDAAGLAQMGETLACFERAQQDLLLNAAEVRHQLPERARQQARADEREWDLVQCRELAVQRSAALGDAEARHNALRERVGAQLGELEQRLAHARSAVSEGGDAQRKGTRAVAEAGERRARSEQRAEGAAATLAERTDARAQAMQGLERFAATGLLAVALPELDIGAYPWTIDGALGVARRTEQALLDVAAEDVDWSRIQNAISHDYTELLRALTALGHQAHAETSDFGLIVTIIYHNRPQRPDLIEASLRDEITQRHELLTARETEVLENHLQAEVAATIQRMLREADQRLDAINTELQKRPTSTGVRFKLLWQTLPEGADGAPVGLEAARKRLLNTSFDAWSAQDRQVVGNMLQSRITAERTRADGEGGSLLEMLGRALDYRHWHRFRVQRWQDGQWRPLSGPASSGERALGLTVPLFAAVSSFYTHGGSKHAPRLVLLDEAFAGIDDAARAHCMGLVREFDLDFVMTSEREWACYAELPGVSICQLQRREGIDAVYVSRWRWDGQARRVEADGVRRFPVVPETAGG
jgi:uncharacterized protein (TIGR02680 family)